KPPTKAALAKLEKAALAQAKKKQKRVKKPYDPLKPKRITGLSKPLKVSPQLSEFFNRTYMARTEVVKHIWKYIKLHNLQDPIDKRYILSDDKIKGLFGIDRLYMYAMNKELNNHFIKLNPEELEAAQAEVDKHLAIANAENIANHASADSIPDIDLPETSPTMSP
ncbi:Upstream activation factor subunit spp27, partial [Smittium culicis]